MDKGPLIKNLFVLIIFIAGVYLFNTSVFGEILLKGEQHGVYERDEYLVTEDVTIPSGKTMTIESGSVIRFAQYTGLIINGKLACLNELGSSTLFTAIENKSGTTAKKDFENIPQWNGIIVNAGASIEFEYVQIFKSVYGIKADKECSEIILKNNAFWENVQDMSISDSVIYIDNNKPVNFVYGVELLDTNEQVSATNITVDVKDTIEVGKQKKKVNWKIPVRICSGTIVVTGCILSYVFHEKARGYQTDTDKSLTTSEANNFETKGNRAYNLRNAFAVIAASGALGFTITFFF